MQFARSADAEVDVAGGRPLTALFGLREVSPDALDRARQHALEADRAGLGDDAVLAHRLLLFFRVVDCVLSGFRSARSSASRRSPQNRRTCCSQASISPSPAGSRL